jgi:hypothetical protein
MLVRANEDTIEEEQEDAVVPLNTDEDSFEANSLSISQPI